MLPRHDGPRTAASLRTLPGFNLGNFMRSLATPKPIKDWSMTMLREKLVKIGAKVVGHARYVGFKMHECCRDSEEAQGADG